MRFEPATFRLQGTEHIPLHHRVRPTHTQCTTPVNLQECTQVAAYLSRPTLRSVFDILTIELKIMSLCCRIAKLVWRPLSRGSEKTDERQLYCDCADSRSWKNAGRRSVRLSVCVWVSVCRCVSACLSVCLTVCLCVCFVYMDLCARVSVLQALHAFNVCVYLYVCISVCSVSESVCMSVSPCDINWLCNL